MLEEAEHLLMDGAKLTSIDIVITRLSYSYRIKCKNCDTWQDFNSTLNKHDMKIKRRLQRWTCRLCQYDNVISYELGLNVLEDD